VSWAARSLCVHPYAPAQEHGTPAAPFWDRAYLHLGVYACLGDGFGQRGIRRNSRTTLDNAQGWQGA
jgi:hypothetical protein